MTSAWTLYVLLVGTLLACAALALDGILRRTTLPTRWVWVSALAGIVCLAVIAPRSEGSRIAYNIHVTRDRAEATVAQSPAATGAAELLHRARALVKSTSTTIIAVSSRHLPDSVAISLSIAWGMASATMLLVLVIVNRRIDRERRMWPLAEVFGTPVRVTPAVGPAVIGLSAPEIVVPRWLLERSIDEQRLVIVHEREHVAARDQLLPVGGLIVAAMLPWHPAVWWALSRLRLAIELDCDARVLNHGVQARPYGALLIDIAGQCAGHRVGALALADRTSHLERRLLAMKNTQPRFTLLRTGALGAIALLSIAVACEARLPTSAEVETMDVAAATKAAVPMMELRSGSGDVLYKVDGVVVTETEAKAIPKDSVAIVSVTKGVQSGGKTYSVVSVSTTSGTKKRLPVKIRFDSGAGATSIETDHLALQPSKRTFNGVLYVDGVQTNTSALESLAPNDIASVEVLKGAAASKISTDPAAANGVIRVTTKQGAEAARKPLFVIDGQIQP